MYRRPNSSANSANNNNNNNNNSNNGHQQSSNGNASYYGGSGYRPNYPTPQNYASNMPNSISQQDKKKAARAKSGGGGLFGFLPSWVTYAVVGCLLLFLVVTRTQVRSARRKADDFKARMSREEEQRRVEAEINERRRKPVARATGAEQTRELQKKLDGLERTIANNKRSEESYQLKVQTIEREKESLVQEVDSLQKAANPDRFRDEDPFGERDDGTSPELKKYQQREKVLKQRINHLKDKIDMESHRDLLDVFSGYLKGSSFFVRFEVRLPDEFDTKSFVVETASVETVPHSVHLFLEQVSHSLWNGCSFIINAAHVLQAGPHALDLGEDKGARFAELELDTVSFQEYNSTYPHDKYTLGFAGRPGGPDFYINKGDNDKLHGPAGGNDVLDEDGDPCFAKVVEGIDVVDEMFRLPTSGSNNMLRSPVEIVKAFLLENDDAHPANKGKTDEEGAAAEAA